MGQISILNFSKPNFKLFHLRIVNLAPIFWGSDQFRFEVKPPYQSLKYFNFLDPQVRLFYNNIVTSFKYFVTCNLVYSIINYSDSSGKIWNIVEPTFDNLIQCP